MAPPLARTSSAYASATRRKSTMPVPGLHSARMPAAWGSISRDALRADLLEALDAVGEGPLLERVEPLQLALVEGDHELAGALDRDVVRLAEPLQLGLALAAQPRLERARLVVQARHAPRRCCGPVWCDASSGSFSRTTMRRSGFASSSRSAVASPRMPPPDDARCPRAAALMRPPAARARCQVAGSGTPSRSPERRPATRGAPGR